MSDTEKDLYDSMEPSHAPARESGLLSVFVVVGVMALLWGIIVLCAPNTTAIMRHECELKCKEKTSLAHTEGFERGTDRGSCICAFTVER